MFEETLPKRPLTWVERLKLRLGLHVHTRRLFVLDDVCMVKCTECGAESMPWKVTREKADAAYDSHKDDARDYALITQRIKEKNCGPLR